MADFFSNYDMNEEVTFTPMYKHVKDWGIAPEELEGKVVAVRFTEAKVFYDLYNNYWGKIFDNVSSDKVTGMSGMFVEQLD